MSAWQYPSCASVRLQQTRVIAVAAGVCASLLLTTALVRAAHNAASGDIFQSTNLLRIAIEIPEDGIQQLRFSQSGFQRRQATQSKPQAQARIIEGGRVYTNVAVQLKGASSFQPIEHLPSLTLNFDKFAPKQKFHGLTKISLNNSAQDPTCLHEKFSRELFAAAGVPVPRADYAVITLNGRKLGLYVLTEGFDKEFLKRYFQRTDGNLYDGGVLQDIDTPLEVTSGKNPTDHTALRRLITATREPDPEKRFRALERALDLERFLSMVAMETILCHSDSYSMNRNNYRVYHDPGADKIVFIPHGMDRVLGAHRSGPDLGVVPPMLGMVARAAISTPEGRRRYIDRAGVLFTNFFQTERLCPWVREIDAKVADERVNRFANRRFHPAFAQSYSQDVANLCARISARADNLKQQFGEPAEFLAPAPTPKFGPDGIAPIGGWKPKPLNRQSRVACEATVRDGKQVLRLVLPEGTGLASLRCRVTLPAGNYWLAGKIIVTGSGGEVPRNLITGRVVRHSSMRFGVEMHPLVWSDLNFGFEVPASRTPEEIEFTCDVRCGPGEVWFDASSLRLVRRDH